MEAEFPSLAAWEADGKRLWGVVVDARLSGLLSVSVPCTSAVAFTRGRYPAFARGTVSSVARTLARCAFSVGLLPYARDSALSSVSEKAASDAPNNTCSDRNPRRRAWEVFLSFFVSTPSCPSPMPLFPHTGGRSARVYKAGQ